MVNGLLLALALSTSVDAHADAQLRLRRMEDLRAYFLATGVMEPHETGRYFQHPWWLDDDEAAMRAREDELRENPDCPTLDAVERLPPSEYCYDGFRWGRRYLRYLDRRKPFVFGSNLEALELIRGDCLRRSEWWWVAYLVTSKDPSNPRGRRLLLLDLKNGVKGLSDGDWEARRWPELLPAAAYNSPWTPED